MDDNKAKALTAALAQIEKQFRQGLHPSYAWVMATLPRTSRSCRPARSAWTLRLALAACRARAGRGGVYGPESSGKTTLTLQVIAEMQSSAAPPFSSTPSMRST